MTGSGKETLSTQSPCNQLVKVKVKVTALGWGGPLQILLCDHLLQSTNKLRIIKIPGDNQDSHSICRRLARLTGPRLITIDIH